MPRTHQPHPLLRAFALADTTSPDSFQAHSLTSSWISSHTASIVGPFLNCYTNLSSCSLFSLSCLISPHSIYHYLIIYLFPFCVSSLNRMSAPWGVALCLFCSLLESLNLEQCLLWIRHSICFKTNTWTYYRKYKEPTSHLTLQHSPKQTRHFPDE